MNEMLAQALRMRELGFAVHWLRLNSKIPLLPGWANAAVLSADELAQTYRPGFNMGFRAGKWSVVDGKEVCVLDVDIKAPAFADEAYAAANVIMAGRFLPDVVTGSGVGRHQYLAFSVGASPSKAATTLRQSDIWVRDGKPCAPHSKESRPAWTIELLSTGKNVVMPPSIHPDTNQPYQWRKGEA